MIGRWLLCLCVGVGALVARGAELPEPDKTIEALLAIVAARHDVVFIRNGSDYNAATAAKFLRGKWDRARAEIKTADDFIAKIAAQSSTTGQPYRLRLPDGREVKCAAFLRDQLAALRHPPTPSAQSTINESVTIAVGSSAPSNRPRGEIPSGK